MKVDRVFALCFTGYRERADRLLPAIAPVVARLGSPPVDVLWQFPSPWNAWFVDRVPHIPAWDKAPGYFGSWLGNFQAAKIGFELGCERVLIVEDDCRFLKDADAVAAELDAAPGNANILMLDHFSMKRRRTKTGNWQKVSVTYSTGAYIIDRVAMARLVRLCESPANGLYARPMLRNSDHWLNDRFLGRDIRMWCAVPNLAIQQNCKDISTGGAWKRKRVKYRRLHLDMKNYGGW